MPGQNRFPVTMSFRTDKATKNKLIAIAHAHGYDPSEWVRKIAFEAAGIDFERRSVRLRIQNAEVLHGFLKELARQSSNLNQITKKVNSEGFADRVQIKSALEQMKDDIKHLVQAIIRLLGTSQEP